MNAHLGLDFGSRRVVFFLHGGITFVRGQIHNVDAAIRDATAQDPTVSGTTEVVVRQDPSVKAVGSSVKLGLIVYIW
jgi:FtsZ-interacting cell division protein YlmF